jgi:hypothetical protein
MTDLAVHLVSDYSDRLPAGAVFACVARCREELRRAGVTSDVLIVTEALVRANLDQRIPPHAGQPSV